MIIPLSLWVFLAVFAVGAFCFCLFVKDRNNYSNVIAGAIAIVLWFVAGLQLFIGISSEGAVYVSGSLAWIFLAIGVIQGIITFVLVLDIVTERKNSRSTYMGLEGLK
jgi:hypothetical protein